MVEDLKERIGRGFMVESMDDMNPEYLSALKQTLLIVGDTELVSVASIHHALHNTPNLNAQISLLSIMQDELGHAHIAFRLLADLGEDIEALLYRRPAQKWKHPYAFDFPMETWPELAVFNALIDRAGYVLLGDAFRHTSYGPWKRGLVKVDKEENFHLRHGETWVRRLCADPAGRAQVQRAVDWLFPMAIEQFGLPDGMKTRGAQLEYRLKGSSNDQLRQQWLRSAMPFLSEVGLEVPAHFDAAQDAYVLDYPFPCDFDPEHKRWHFDRPVTWDDVLTRWRRRGRSNQAFIAWLQRGARELATLREAVS